MCTLPDRTVWERAYESADAIARLEERSRWDDIHPSVAGTAIEAKTPMTATTIISSAIVKPGLPRQCEHECEHARALGLAAVVIWQWVFISVPRGLIASPFCADRWRLSTQGASRAKRLVGSNRPSGTALERSFRRRLQGRLSVNMHAR
jgi:hypothetical protein